MIYDWASPPRGTLGVRNESCAGMKTDEKSGSSFDATDAM
jgi:hypothetical protein